MKTDVLKVVCEPFFELIKNDNKSNRMVNDQTVAISCKTEYCAVHGKMGSLSQCDSGQFYHLCHTSCSNSNDPERIQSVLI